jgi:hypothetical protein
MTSCVSPPSAEITLPVPRQGVHTLRLASVPVALMVRQPSVPNARRRGGDLRARRGHGAPERQPEENDSEWNGDGDGGHELDVQPGDTGDGVEYEPQKPVASRDGSPPAPCLPGVRAR